MSIADKIEKQKAELINKYVASYKKTGTGLSKALKLMYQDIEKMRTDKLSLSEQIDILNGIFEIEIKYDTFKKWSARYFKNTVSETTKVAHYEPKKTQRKERIKEDKTTQKEVKKVAPKEPKKTTFTTAKIFHNPVANMDELI